MNVDFERIQTIIIQQYMGQGSEYEIRPWGLIMRKDKKPHAVCLDSVLSSLRDMKLDPESLHLFLRFNIGHTERKTNKWKAICDSHVTFASKLILSSCCNLAKRTKSNKFHENHQKHFNYLYW